MVKLSLNATKSNNNSALTRNWSTYCPFNLNCLLLPMVNYKCFMFKNYTAQSYWNLLENVILKVTDIIAPLNNLPPRLPKSKNTSFAPGDINAKINECKRLLKYDRLSNSNTHFSEIKNLSKEIKSHFINAKKTRVRGVALGNTARVICGKQ